MLEMFDNDAELCDHGNEDARRTALAIAETALEAVHPATTVPSHISRSGSTLDIDGRRYDLEDVETVSVIGAGKGSAHLVEALESVLGPHLGDALVVEKTEHGPATAEHRVVEAGHPLPDSRSVAAADDAIALAEAAGEQDLVFVCITGGASALLAAPAGNIDLEELESLTASMLQGGLPIHEINTVRKHISAIKGGRLARRIEPARLVTLVIVDEVAGEPWGPTIGDETTFADAVGVLQRRGLWEETPATIRTHLQQGVEGAIPETPTPGERREADSQVVVLADASDLCEAAAEDAAARGYNVEILSSVIEGESREVGTVLAGIATELRQHERPLEPPCVLVSGGETTVTIRGEAGRGGPNQELALRFALAVDGLEDVVLLSLGTDGTDGPTDVAGGLVDDVTSIRADRRDLFDHLDRHDSTTALVELGDAVRTGSTGTNVMDLRLLLFE